MCLFPKSNIKSSSFIPKHRLILVFGCLPKHKEKYRNLINEKKDEHKRKQTLKLGQACDNKNPKEFWRFLKSSKNSPSAYISTNDWYNYFSNLVNPIIKSENEEAILVTDELLDAPITLSEIRHSIMILKKW